MRLLLLGDLHFFQLGVWPYQLLSKRLLGQTNLWFNRRRHFRLSLWPAIRDRVRALAPDGLLCSGDFTTTALPGEFRQAAAHWRELIEDLSYPPGRMWSPAITTATPTVPNDGSSSSVRSLPGHAIAGPRSGT